MLILGLVILTHAEKTLTCGVCPIKGGFWRKVCPNRGGFWRIRFRAITLAHVLNSILRTLWDKGGDISPEYKKFDPWVQYFRS